MKKRKANTKPRVSRRTSKQKEQSRLAIEVRKRALLEEQEMVRRTRKVIRTTEPKLSTSGKLAIIYDGIFRAIEPNFVKRNSRLKRIFFLRPTVADAKWIDIIELESRRIRDQSRRVGIRKGLIKLS